MSWQGYVDTLIATGHVTDCGIFGNDGSPWSTSPNFPITADSIKALINATQNSQHVANGVNVKHNDALERYILVKGDAGVSVLLKKGQKGLIAFKANQCCIIAVHGDNVKSEVALNDVGKVIDYLIKHGY